MKKILIPAAVCLAMLLSFVATSCKKSAVPTGPSSFSWVVKGVNTVATWDSAFAHSRSTMPIIVAGKGAGSSSGPQLIISISSFSKATYSIGNGNELQYSDDAMNVYFGISGSVIITGFSNNRLSGNFSVDLAGPMGSFPITGQFINVPVAL